MYKRLQVFIFLILACGMLYLINCVSSPTEPGFQEDLIINGYLVVGHGVDSIFVSKSLPIAEPYDDTQAAVSGASVMISADGHSYRLLEYDDTPGAYYLHEDTLTITPGKQYDLEVRVEDKVLRSSTVAPEQVHIVSLNNDTAYYPYPESSMSPRFQITWNPTEHTAAYDISIIAKPPYELVDFGMEKLVESILEEYDNDTLRAFRPVHDFPVNNNQTSAEISWYAFSYYGDYTIKLYAIDENLWDLVACNVVYTPQSSEFEQPVFNIEGGLGIFAAVSVDSVHAFVKRQE